MAMKLSCSTANKIKIVVLLRKVQDKLRRNVIILLFAAEDGGIQHTKPVVVKPFSFTLIKIFISVKNSVSS